MVDKANLSSCSSASERSSRLSLEVVAMSMLVWLDTLTGLSQSWGERHFFTMDTLKGDLPYRVYFQ